MSTPAKIGVVIAGYLFAGFVACAAVALNDAARPGPERSGGMAAFGDSLLFLAVFALAAIPASSTALYFLRGQARFWAVLAVAGPTIALTAVVAAVVSLATRGSASGSGPSIWSMYAVLRVVAAPLCALAFLLAGIFAPKRPWRIALLSAATVEAASFASVVLTMLVQTA
jgi:hypothetical protein